MNGDIRLVLPNLGEYRKSCAFEDPLANFFGSLFSTMYLRFCGFWIKVTWQQHTNSPLGQTWHGEHEERADEESVVEGGQAAKDLPKKGGKKQDNLYHLSSRSPVIHIVLEPKKMGDGPFASIQKKYL